MLKRFFNWLVGGYSELPPVPKTTTSSDPAPSSTDHHEEEHPDPEVEAAEDASGLLEEVPGEPVTVTTRSLSGDNEPPQLLDIGEVELVELDEIGEIEEVDLEVDPANDDATPSVQSGRTQRYLWCLDNGHGELQKGKRAPAPVDGKLFEEWEFNRDIVRRIIESLQRNGVAFYNVVPETQVESFLKGRVDRANNKQSDLPKIYVSIHANAAGLPGPGQFANGIGGLETFHFPGSKSGKRLATTFQRYMVSELGWRDRGVKEYPFYVLKHTSMPSVLTENGFYTDEEQTRKLLSDEWRQKIANAHIRAILEIERDGI
jgi:N-acetylmuramoyl-L-alanine amidase